MRENPLAIKLRTDDLPHKDRFAWWREEISRPLMRLDIEARDPCSFAGSVDMMQLPIGKVARMHCDAAICTRTPTLAQQGADEFMFAMVDVGGYRVEGGYNAIEVNQGDGMLAFQGTQCVVNVRDTNNLTLIQLYAPTLRQAVRDIDDRLFHHLPSSNEALRLLTSYARAVIQEGAPTDPALAHLVNTHVIDLIALGLRPGGETMERAMIGALPSARFAAVRTDILAHLSDANLTAREISRRQNLSERYVYLLFEQNGMSLGSFVTNERLKRAVAMLLDPACGHMRISDIAFATGFSDLTTFNRAFRRRHGRTPSEVRKETNGEEIKPEGNGEA